MSSASDPVTDRRRFPRYRFVEHILIRKAGGLAQSGMSLEIGAGGMSIATDQNLQVGEQVELDAVLDAKVGAIVRYSQGRIHGFEFVGISQEHMERIRTACRKLPRFYVKSLDI
jgi:hypothetical protein